MPANVKVHATCLVHGRATRVMLLQWTAQNSERTITPLLLTVITHDTHCTRKHKYRHNEPITQVEICLITVIMAALCSRCGHYIFVLFLSIFLPFFLSFFLFLFPRLISAIADWLFTILLHMAWP